MKQSQISYSQAPEMITDKRIILDEIMRLTVTKSR